MRSILFTTLLLCSGVPSAADFAVTKTQDTNDGACNTDCSLREAVRAANVSGPGPHVVTVPAGTYALTLAGADEIAAFGDLDVQASMQIVGAGAATTIVDAGGADRAFHIDPEGDGNITVTLQGLTIRNGAEAFGGVVFNGAANLTLAQSIVRDGTARNGGCLFSGTAFTLTGTSLINCRAQTTGDTSNGFGGGIFAFGAPMTINGSTFTGNEASRNGGAIYRAGNTGSIAASTFSQNTAGGQGGAMELTGTATLTVEATFTDNTANDGGAISVLSGPVLTLAGGTFRGNDATGTDLGGGGAIFVFTGSVDATGTLFDANTALGEGGGALLVGGNAGSSFDGTNTTFTGNMALPHGTPLPGSSEGLGGALLVINGTVNTLADSTLSGNIANKSGGAIYVDQGAQMSIGGGAILDNVAQQLFGGAILNEGATALSGLVVEGNSAEEHSGAISSAIGSLTLTDVELRDNEASSGGALGNFSGGTLTMRRSTIAQNRATGPLPNQGFGGGLLFDTGVATIENSTFSGNTSAAGGGISNNGGGGGATMSLFNVTIADNTGTGSAVARFNTGTVSVRNSILSGNCNANLTTAGGNVESPGNTCGLGPGGDLRNVAPASLALAALGAYGGPTRTHDLLPASVAIDFVQAGQCTGAGGLALATDQRGVDRPFDGNTPPDGTARCDSGAVEKRPLDAIFANSFE